MTTDRSPERRFLILMARQHGLGSRRQAYGAGVTRKRLDHLIADGLIRSLGDGVYLQLGARKTFEQSVMTACLAINGALASHETAAALHLGPDFRRNQLHVLVPFGSRSRTLTGAGLEVVVHRTRSLTSSDKCKVAGIPATSPARTLLDLAASPAASQAASGGSENQWLDHLLGEYLATKRIQPGALTTSLQRARVTHHLGRARLQRTFERALELDIERTESPPERRFLLLIAAHGLPRPAVQYEIRDQRGDFICRADFAWPDKRLIVEIDGSRWHSSLAAREKDRARDARLRAAGWTILRFSPADVDNHAQRVLASVCELLGVADALK